MSFWILSSSLAAPLLVLLRSSFEYLVERLLWLALFLCIAYSLGWFHRFLHWIAEHEATKLLNGTVVTLGSLQTDLIRGQAWASNVVIHAPHQQAWQWEAPVLARIGKVHVEANILQCLFFLWFYQQEIPLELYTVHCSDIQVFVERKHNLYNFFLLDPHVISPDMELLRKTNSTKDDDNPQQQQQAPVELVTEKREFHSLDSNQSMDNDDDNDNTRSNGCNDKAQQVVDDMLTAVRRAAQEGDHGAFWTH